jgi:hypothetical protein
MTIAASSLPRLKTPELLREAALIGGEWRNGSERNETFDVLLPKSKT